MTLVILVITCAVSLLAFSNNAVMNKLIFSPYAVYHNKQGYRFFTSGLIHADFFHLFINMFVFYSFGGMVEEYYKFTFGEKAQYYFILLYVGAIGFSILPTYKRHRDNPRYFGLGASGAVSAIVFSFILFNPLQNLCLYGLLCFPGIIFGVLYLVFCIYMDKKGKDNVNHGAHLWGAVFGFVFTVILQPTLLVDFFQKLVYFRTSI